MNVSPALLPQRIDHDQHVILVEPLGPAGAYRVTVLNIEPHGAFVQTIEPDGDCWKTTTTTRAMTVCRYYADQPRAIRVLADIITAWLRTPSAAA